MTDEQISKAIKYIDYHTEINKYSKPMLDFLKGYIEMIDDLNINKLYDIIVSNCVVNLSLNKEAVLKQVYKHLKNGGEFYFSDVYASQRIPLELQKNPTLWGECLSWALYWNDFLNLAKNVVFLIQD